MISKRSTTEAKPSTRARLVRAGLASLAVAGTAAALATGCLDRPVVKQSPKTSNVFVDQIVQTAVDKIDLLFMVDNSVSMADKQAILKDAVPVLVSRLTAPICVDVNGKPTGESSNAGHCANGSPEFTPIGDIHIGIVSSSLGGHGGVVCSAADGVVVNPDDKAHLIGSMRPDKFPIASTWNGSGFLAWDAKGTANNPPGESKSAALQTSFQNMIAAVGEHGCGYEASLESWYRFLVDPEPPAQVTQVNRQTVRGSSLAVNADGTLGACTGCDDTLLAQRKAFLRPDSLVAIVMLSDENDCSIRDDGVGWFVGSQSPMPRSTSVCDENPNAPCCRSCAQNEAGGPPSGCMPLSSDANCKNITSGSYATWDNLHDSLNLRCYNQHKRFGFDLLYETGRYVSALTNTTIALQSNGRVITNPLYDNTGSDKAPRDPSLVFLAGIVGVPWQDIADDASLTDPAGLTYLTAKQLRDKGRWTALLGDPHPPSGAAPSAPTDPFMIETTEPRMGTNTIAQPPVSIVPANSTNPHANVINGHEQNIPKLDDLQYACIFPLQAPKDCAVGDVACDCSADKSSAMPPDPAGDNTAVKAANSPLCQGGTSINQQTSAKAYPGARELQVLKDLGDNAIVASICPKVVKANGAPASDPNYGYNPAVGAIINRLKDALKGKCLPRAIESAPIDVDHPELGSQVLCKVVEAQKSGCNCALGGRAEVAKEIVPAVLKQLKLTGQCGTGTQAPCETWCECEIVQEKNDANGDNLTKCQSNQVAAPGYCYVDKTVDSGGQLKSCPANQQQLLRFVDDGQNPTPAKGAVAFIACLGAPVGADADAGM